MTFLGVEELRKIYRMGGVEVAALRGLSLSVEEGHLVTIIGPSGSGKTTLLSIIGGLLPATSGQVRLRDTVVTDLSTNGLADYRLRTVGHIFQSLNLIPFLSVAENIAFPLITLGVPSQERNARVDGLLAAMDLVARRRHRPHELSGGEQQRVAIAAALANDPPLLLADEPTGELDTETSRQIVEYLLRVNKENKKTILLVTHDPVVARVGDQILRIQDGQIAGIYQPESVVGHEEQDVLVQYLRRRIAHIEDELARLDRAMKKKTIDGESYAASRRRLRTAQHVLRDELHRIGES